MPRRPCQDILKALQSERTITNIQTNYTKTLKDMLQSLTDVLKGLYHPDWHITDKLIVSHMLADGQNKHKTSI